MQMRTDTILTEVKMKDQETNKKEELASPEERPIELFTEDDFEDDPDTGGENGEENAGKKGWFRRLKRWQKAVLIAVLVVVVLASGLTGGFFYLRAKGEKNLKTEVPPTSEEAEEEGLFVTYKGKEYKYNEDIISFLCLGIDKDIPIEEKRETGSEGLADAVILVSVDVESGRIQMLSIPRDTIVPVKVLDKEGKFVKTENGQITLQYAYGRTAAESCELMTDAVSNLLYRLPIQRYCSINFQAVPKLNDAIGGVDVEVMEDIYGENCTLYAGNNVHLEGMMALDYVRWRAEWEYGSNMDRIARQKQYMTNYFDKAKTVVQKDLTLPVKVFNELKDNMCTNVTVEDITYLVPELLDITLNAEDMQSIPGEITQPGEYEEFHPYEEELKELVISSFYEEVEQTED